MYSLSSSNPDTNDPIDDDEVSHNTSGMQNYSCECNGNGQSWCLIGPKQTSPHTKLINVDPPPSPPPVVILLMIHLISYCMYLSAYHGMDNTNCL